MTDKSLFKRLIALISEKYQTEISAMMTRVIWEAVKQYPDSQCEKAFQDVILRGRFFKDLVPDLMEILEGKADDQSTEAWVVVHKAVRRIGPYDSVRFDDPAIHSVIHAFGGWVAFQDCTDAEWKWRKKEFEGLDRVMARQQNHPEYLPGDIEIKNVGRGYDAPPPKLIESGRHDQARLLTAVS